jgi:anaerobic selenocysteine-containing dehydrogenase
VADEWVGITPGTDGLFIGALIHELLKAGKIDLDYLPLHQRAQLVIRPNRPSMGLIARDKDGKPLVMDRETPARPVL